MTRTLLGAAPLLLGACASAELDVPVAHPGHPQARTGRVAQTEALTSAYGLEAGSFEAAAPSNEHAHHQHGAESGSGATEKSPATASEPISAAAFTCPMHPEIVRQEPGTCPICGMKLVPKKDAK